MIGVAHTPSVSDDYQIGRMVQEVRRAHKLRQVDVAARAGVGCESVSRLERGQVDGMTVGTLRAISKAMGMPSIAQLGWRSPEIDRLRDKRHAQLVEAAGRLLVEADWQVQVEYTFSHYGERGAVDVLAWHSAKSALLIGEVKTRVWDLQDLLSTLDRKRRLVPTLLRREPGWRADGVGVVLAMPESSTHRHLIERYSAVFDSALPDRQRRVRQWLETPIGDLRGILFLPISHQIGMRKPAARPARRGASDRGL